MAAQNPPSFMQNVATETAAQARNLISGLVSSGGVVGTNDMTTAQHLTGNMSVDVAGGAAFIPGTSATLQGMYHVYSDSTLTNLAISTADPTNPRIDTVIAQVQDAFYAGAANAWQYAIVTGTPTSGATLVNLNGKGAVPASSIVLAYVLVPATATSIVTADLLDARVKADVGGAGGQLAVVAGTSNVSLSTSEATLVTVSANLPANRRIRLTGYVPATFSISADSTATFKIKEGSTELSEYNMFIRAGFVSGGCHAIALSGVSGSGWATPSAGTHTYTLTGILSTGTASALGSATASIFLMVEDLGAV